MRINPVELYKYFYTVEVLSLFLHAYYIRVFSLFLFSYKKYRAFGFDFFSFSYGYFPCLHIYSY